MDPKFQNSFIPKKPLIQQTEKPHRTTSFFSLIVIMIFVTVLALSLATYGYKFYVRNNNEKLKEELAVQVQKFEPSLIAELSRMDDRMNSSKKLIDQHLALTGFFDFLSNTTLRSVRFLSLSYEVEGKDIKINMQGQATSFGAIALQSSEFLKSENQKFIKSPVFTDLDLDETGNVKFLFTGVVESKELLYKNSLTGAVVPKVEVEAATTTVEIASTTTNTF